MGKHSEKLVPANSRLAAKRAGLRTAAQALASLIPTSAITVTLTGEWLLGVALGVGGAIITSVLAGLASFLSILSEGIPVEYAPELDAGEFVVED